MGERVVLALRVVLATALAGSVFVQAVMVPLIWIDLDGAASGLRIVLVAIIVLGIVTLQVTGVCLWRLVTMVRRGTVFSAKAFNYVDVIIGAAAAAAFLIFALGVALAPGEDVPPGMVLLIGGLGWVAVGVSLVVLVLRTLLAQATQLRAELDEVI